MRQRTYACAIVLAAVLLCAAAAVHIVRAEAFMAEAGRAAGRIASQQLGTDVQIGAVEIRSLHELAIDDIVIYDKQTEEVLRADRARVTLRLFSLLSSPATSVDEILLTGVHAHPVQREDGSWNYADLVSDDAEPSAFVGRIRIADGTVDAVVAGRSYELTDLSGAVDVDRGAFSYDASAQFMGIPLRVRGEKTSDVQNVQLAADDADLTPLLSLLPEGTLPEHVQIRALHADRVRAGLRLVDGARTMEGRIEGVRADADLYGTQTTLTSAALRFDERALFVAATATAAEQTARVDGTVRLDTDAPYLDLRVRAERFAPAAVYAESPYTGTVSADVRVTGTMDAPTVDGHVSAEGGTVSDIDVTRADADVAYADGILSFQNLAAEAFGGNIAGEGTLSAADLSYAAHLKIEGLPLDHLRTDAQLPLPADLSGILSADLGIEGQGTERTGLAVYGSAEVLDGMYRAVPIERANASFSLRGQDLTIDFLSLNLPHGTDLGVEGTIRGGAALDLRFYGGHVDLSLLNRLDDRLSFAGLADISGEVHGNIADPHVDMKVSATHGQLMYQPFDSLLFRAEGSLSGIGIHDFSMERNGREVWLVNGTIGFTGERRINLQIDTMGARMEDVAALVAPDQPITGNIDNIIKFTGTLDNPHAVGYVHFYRGSYAGALLSGMDGDYFLDDGVIRLQVFHIYSPMVDMVLNGTISTQGVLNLDAEVRDLNFKRFAHKFPYPVAGHGVFHGQVGGTISYPIFRGDLKADEVTMNGVTLTKVHSLVYYENGIVTLDRTGFHQGEKGKVSARLHYDTHSDVLRGTMDVENFDVGALLALGNQKEDRVGGSITSHIWVGGTRDNPSLGVTGEIAAGTVAGYPVTDASLDVSLSNHVLTIDRLTGKQGDGSFSASGTVDFNGMMDVDATANDIALGIFTGLAGIDEPVSGTASVTAHVGGTAQSPVADVSLSAKNGGVRGGTFDALAGEIQVRGSVVRVNQLTVHKYIGGVDYTVSVHGTLPLHALTADADEMLSAAEQIDLTLSLDHADLSLLPVFSREIEWALGRTEGEVTIRGSLAAPRINGSLRIRDGAVKLKAIETPITEIEVQVDALGDSIAIRECTGRMGTGSYLLTGHTGLSGLRPANYEFMLVMNALSVKTSFYDGPLTGALKLTEDTYWGETLPKVSGTVDIDRALISIPTIPDTDSELPNIILDVGVSVGRHVHFFSPNLYDMHPSGQIHFGGTTRHPKTTGMIGVRRGDTVSYLRTVFKIHEGTATFNQMESFLPTIDFYAETRLTNMRIYLSARGPLDHMDFRLGSSPEMSEEEILRMLTLRGASQNGEGKFSAADVLAIGLQMSVLSEVENSMKNMLHLDVFRLSSGSGSLFESKEDVPDAERRNEYNLEIGKYIGDRVFVRYVQGLGAAANKSRYGIQYDLSDAFGISYDREGSEQIIGMEARIRF